MKINIANNIRILPSEALEHNSGNNGVVHSSIVATSSIVSIIPGMVDNYLLLGWEVELC